MANRGLWVAVHGRRGARGALLIGLACMGLVRVEIWVWWPNWRLGLHLRCVARSVAVAQSGCPFRLRVHTGVNQGYLLEYEREYIRGGGGESRVL
jgi:uncharacterized membrane protein YqjE